MKLIVNPHKIEIIKEPVNEREIDITKCEFEFADEITNNYVKEAYFTFNGTTYKQIIVNNECDIPSEVLAKKGQVEIGVVAFLVENEEEIKRYNPSPAYFNTWLGSLKDNAENSEPITPSEMEQFEQALNDGLNEVANVDIDAEQLDNGMSVTITNRYGEDKTVYAYDGEKGETGATPNIQIGTVVTGNHSEVTRTGTNENPIFNFVLEKGDKGDTGTTGNGITSYEKTSTSGLVDTYTITFTNGETTTLEVTNGRGIVDILKTSTSGNIDTYTIYYNDNTTDTFTVTNSTVTNQEFNNLKNKYDTLVNTLPKITGSGTSVTLNNAAKYYLDIQLSSSEITQDGTPTPDVPIVVNTVTGNNTITISNVDNTQSQNYSINLGNIEYCKLGTVEDKIYRDENGDWYFEEHIKKLVLDGTETITNQFGASLFGTNLPQTKLYATGVSYSNYYKFNSIQTGLNAGLPHGEFATQYGSTLYIKDTRYTAVNDFKNFLSNNNVKFYYGLNTPITTQITDTTLVTQLENLYQNAQSYNGTTNVTQTNAELPFNIDASALYDLNNLISRVATLEVEV